MYEMKPSENCTSHMNTACR